MAKGINALVLFANSALVIRRRMRRILFIAWALILLTANVFADDKKDPRTFLKLHHDFVGEQKEKSLVQAIYLKPSERSKYRIKFIDGKMVDQSGNLFDTRGMSNGTSNFVLDKNRIFYTSRRKEALRFEHSSYVAGADIICAGSIQVRDGVLLRITDISAQYVAHPYYNLRLVVKFLKESGIDFKKVKMATWIDA